MTMTLNLTQHPGSTEQNVVDLTGGRLTALKDALTFDVIPTVDDILGRAAAIAHLACQEVGEDDQQVHAMIGGAPYLMGALERALRLVGIEPVYAFSLRESVEQKQPDGSVRKTTVFRHGGFVPASK